jgi:hypothetical protein
MDEYTSRVERVRDVRASRMFWDGEGKRSRLRSFSVAV